MRNSNLILAALGGLCFLQAQAGADAWPLTNATHRAYFCGGELGGDQGPPAGYTRAEAREVAALMKKRRSATQAVHDLQARARCSEVPPPQVVELELAPVGIHVYAR